MIMTITAILTLLTNAISTDATLASWITTNYPGKTLTVFVGEDDVAPPTEADAPFVSITLSPRPQDVGTFDDSWKPTFEVEFGLKDGRKTTVGNVITQTGEVNRAAFADLLTAVLTAALTGTTGDHFAEAQLQFFGVAPLWQGGFSITLDYQSGMGDPT